MLAQLLCNYTFERFVTTASGRFSNFPPKTDPARQYSQITLLRKPFLSIETGPGSQKTIALNSLNPLLGRYVTLYCFIGCPHDSIQFPGDK
jgi:hypothetical protein